MDSPVSAGLPSISRSECCCGSDCMPAIWRLQAFLPGVSGLGLWHSPFELQQLFCDDWPPKSFWQGKQPPIASTAMIRAGRSGLCARKYTAVYSLALARQIDKKGMASIAMAPTRWHPARRLVTASERPIDNRPQINNLPHNITYLKCLA